MIKNFQLLTEIHKNPKISLNEAPKCKKELKKLQRDRHLQRERINNFKKKIEASKKV